MEKNDYSISLAGTGTFVKDFDTLFNDLYPALVYFANKYVDDTTVSQDIVQEIFVTFWLKCCASEQFEAGKNYLYKCVYNASIDYLRQKKVDTRRLDQYLYLKNDYTRFNDLITESELYSRIEKAKSGLPDQCKRVFMLSREEGLSYKQIAQQLDISVRTVESHMRKALKIFRSKLYEFTT